MFLSPNTLFFLNPIPRRRLESSRTEGNETPVLDSTTVEEEEEFSAKESEPQSGSEQWLDLLEKSEFSAFLTNGSFGSWHMAIAAAPAVATTAEAARKVEAVVVGLVWGSFGFGFGGWENKNGKRRETIALVVVFWEYSGNFKIELLGCIYR